MRLELDPPVGVGLVRLGMPCQDLKTALSDYGEPSSFSRGETNGWAVERATSIFVHCDANRRASAVEFATPGFGERSSDVVVFRNIDLFGTNADEVVRSLRAAGARVDESEGGYSYTAPDLLLALWRDGGPTAADGMPLFFESALIAKPGYYD